MQVEHWLTELPPALLQQLRVHPETGVGQLRHCKEKNTVMVSITEPRKQSPRSSFYPPTSQSPCRCLNALAVGCFNSFWHPTLVVEVEHWLTELPPALLQQLHMHPETGVGQLWRRDIYIYIFNRSLKKPACIQFLDIFQFFAEQPFKTHCETICGPIAIYPPFRYRSEQHSESETHQTIRPT